MDLHILAADKNLEFALRGVLDRHRALGIREITYEIEVHSGRDGGVRSSGVDVLALEQQRYGASLMVMDFEGSGTSERTGIELERVLDAGLASQLQHPSKAIVIDPECDLWVWGSDNSLSGILGWENNLGIRAWLQENDFSFTDGGKPLRPKEAFEKLLRELRKPRSSALYRKVTSAISLERCVDPSFVRLRDVLREWFPA